MIFQTQNHLNSFLIFVFSGIIFGFIFLICNLIFLLKFKKNIQKNIIISTFYLMFFIFFTFLINFFNFGNFSLLLLFTYILSFIWTKSTFNKSVVILEKRWYNKTNQVLTTIKQKGKSKTNDTNKKS